VEHVAHFQAIQLGLSCDYSRARDFFLQPKEKGCTEMGNVMVRPKTQTPNKTWRHLGTRLTHRKTLTKSPGSTDLGGHSFKLGPYKIRKLKDLGFFQPVLPPTVQLIKLYLARGRSTRGIVILQDAEGRAASSTRCCQDFVGLASYGFAP